MKNAMSYVAIAAALLLAACAGPAPKTLGCDAEPIRTTAQPNGQRVGIFLCYGSRGELLYAARPIAALPPAALTPEQVREAKHAAARAFEKTAR